MYLTFFRIQTPLQAELLKVSKERQAKMRRHPTNLL